jgi:hypothetical protein
MTAHEPEPQLDPETLVARIIAELQANPDAQRLLLRALLTNEFLGMPARLDRIEQDIVEIKGDVSQLKLDVSQLKVDVSQLKLDVSQLKVDVSQLKVDVVDIRTRLGHLEGDSLEGRVHRSVRPLLSQRLGLRRPQLMQSAYQDSSSELLDSVDDSLDDGRISERQLVRIGSTDAILRARRPGSSQNVWVAVEVSNKVGNEDISRARESADALATVFHQETLAVVVGYSIDPPDQQRANDADVLYLEISRPS